MVGIVTHQAVRILCFLVLTAIAVFQFRIALLAQSEFSDQKVSNPLLTYQYNPRMLTWHGKQRLKDDAARDEAETLYRAALIANPLYIPAWLSLAELQYDRGDKESANAVLDLVDRYTESVKRWRWNKALLAYQLQRQDILARDLAYIVREIRGQPYTDALQMAFLLWPDPAELKVKIGSENIVALFRYAVQTKKIEVAIALWPDIGALGIENHQKEVLSFLEMLITMDSLPLASDIWREFFNSNTLFFDGAFVDEPLQSAFGWRIGKVKGAVWRIDKKTKDQPSRALHIHFNQQENLNFHHAYQVVPLTGGMEYRLRGQWKSKALTTDQRPFVEVYGYKCKAPQGKTEMVGDDQPWSSFDLLFRVPEECKAMVVRIRRNPSHHIDNQLGGDLWLTDFEISAMGTPSTEKKVEP
jgi:tetratricopeptide (TPR) repeat protein